MWDCALTQGEPRTNWDKLVILVKCKYRFSPCQEWGRGPPGRPRGIRTGGHKSDHVFTGPARWVGGFRGAVPSRKGRGPKDSSLSLSSAALPHPRHQVVPLWAQLRQVLGQRQLSGQWTPWDLGSATFVSLQDQVSSWKKGVPQHLLC